MIPRVRALPHRLRPPRSIRSTPAGKAFLLLTLAVGGAAINTGNNLLYIALSMNLGLIILSGIFSESVLRRARVRIRQTSEAFAGTPVLLSVTLALEGKGRPAQLPPVPLAVAFRVGEFPTETRFGALRPGGSSRRLVEATADRRGYRRLTGVTVSTLFPFGIFRKTAYLEEPEEPLLVYPKPPGERGPREGESRGASDGETPEARGRGPDIRGIRDHTPHDPARDIHWKASAKRGKWVVREREGETAPVEEIRLPGDADADTFEAAVSRACGTVLACEGSARPYRIWRDDALRVDARSPGRRADALGYLALATAREGGKPTADGGTAP